MTTWPGGRGRGNRARPVAWRGVQPGLRVIALLRWPMSGGLPAAPGGRDWTSHR